jgi:hypothetical protein
MRGRSDVGQAKHMGYGLSSCVALHRIKPIIEYDRV